MERKCLTPGAIYHFDINSGGVTLVVVHHQPIDMNEEEAKKLEDELHDAVEAVLGRYY